MQFHNQKEHIKEKNAYAHAQHPESGSKSYKNWRFLGHLLSHESLMCLWMSNYKSIGSKNIGNDASRFGNDFDIIHELTDGEYLAVHKEFD